MEMPTLSALPAPSKPSFFKDANAEVIEIGLLLPKKRAEALIDLSRRRGQSVGQILRQLIDSALVEDRSL